MCRETVPEIGGGDWKGPPADSIARFKMEQSVVRMWMIGVAFEMARQ